MDRVYLLYPSVQLMKVVSMVAITKASTNMQGQHNV